jgi:hypothetical protein
MAIVQNGMIQAFMMAMKLTVKQARRDKRKAADAMKMEEVNLF